MVGAPSLTGTFRELRLRAARYNAVTSKPTLGNDFLGPDRERGETAHTSYALLYVRGAGGTRHSSVDRSAVPVGPPLALAWKLRTTC